MENGNGKTLVRSIQLAVLAAVLSAAVTAYFTMNSGNSKRDGDIVALQTTVKDLGERLTRDHDEVVSQLAAIKSEIRQLDIDTARIGEKIGVTASPGIR